ncbi:AsmA-like C-terminal region-containing protein [Verrucomicrobiota bacterium]
MLINTGFSVDLSETNKLMRLDKLSLVRKEGRVQGGCEVNFVSQTVDFDAISTADPRSVAQMIGPFMKELVCRFRVEGPVNAMGSGIVGYIDQEKNDVDVFIESQKLGWQKFLFDRCSLHVRVIGADADLNDIEGVIYGGRASGSASIYHVLGATNMRYEVDGEVKDVDFGVLMHTVTGGRSDLYRGKCSGGIYVEGYAGDGQGKTAVGHGDIDVADGRIFQVPIFGGLSDMLTKVVPGLSILLRQTDAKASVVIRDGKIHSDGIFVEGDVLSLRGEGNYSLDGKLDFGVQVTFLRKHTFVGEVVRIVTLPVSKILEFHLGGTIKAPRWRPVFLPKEMFFIFDQDDDL